MSEPIWAEPDSIEGNVFPPFAESLKLLNNRELSDDAALTNGENNDTIIVGNNDICKDADGECTIVEQNDGGPGSGRYPKGSGESDKESGNATGKNTFGSGFEKQSRKEHFER